MICYPNCKINIGLDILRRRPDGFHDIDSALYPVPWTDILEIVPASGGKDTLTITGNPVNCPIEKNLVFKAITALRDKVDFPPVDVYLHKIIPDGAGLGGGSADAAFAISLVNNLFELGLSTEFMATVAAEIGSDCPFFIYNTPMHATGRGTELSPVDISLGGFWIVIAKHRNASVSTAQAYSGVKPQIPEMPLINRLNKPIETWTSTVINMFEDSVFHHENKIADVKTRMMSISPIYTAMSGSGAAVFGLFDSEITEDAIKRLFPDCDTFVSRL